MSDASEGWFLTHGDGEVHGPYSLAALIQAANIGHISDVTQVRHSTLTKDQWVPAPRIRGIAEALKSTSPRVSSPPAVTDHTAGKQAVTTPQAATAARTAGPRPESATQTRAGSVGEGPPPVELKRSRPHRYAGGRTMVVPETFGGAVAALFDFRFRYFVTPWIVTTSWSVSVLVGFVLAVLFTIVFLIQPLSAPAASPSGSGQSESAVVAESSGGQGNWQFEPPQAISSVAGRLILYVAVMLCGSFALLYLRVILEAAVVAFRIAADLAEINERQKKQTL